MADERTVQFWRIRHKDESDLPWPFPAAQIVRKLKKAEDDRLNRYRSAKDGVVVLGEGITSTPASHVVLYRTRRNNLPHIDLDGKVSDLDLPDGGGLAEPTHFAFHARNIVSVLYNNNGPRAGRLLDYINAKFGCEIDLVPIYREDLAAILEQMRQTRIDVTMPASQAIQLTGTDEDDWVSPLVNAADLLEGGNISIRVSIGQKGKGEEKAARAGRLRELMNQLRGRNDLKGFKSIKVHGTEIGTSNQLTVDLLEQRFILRTEVPAGPNGVAPGDARSVLVAEYGRNKKFLEDATPAVTGSAPAGTVGAFVPLPPDEEGDDDE